MSSARLPGKVLAPIAGVPMLELILRRVRSARLLNELIVATTVLPSDDGVANTCAELGVTCFRGSLEDCLDRIYQAAVPCAPDVVVRLTGDNPAPDGDFVDWVVGQLVSRGDECDYVDTMTTRTFPYGLSVEAVRFAALAAAWREARDPADREHVTKFVRERPERFKHIALSWERDDHGMRLSVDYPDDLTRMDELFRAAGSWRVGWRELVELASEVDRRMGNPRRTSL